MFCYDASSFTTSPSLLHPRNSYHFPDLPVGGGLVLVGCRVAWVPDVIPGTGNQCDLPNNDL